MKYMKHLRKLALLSSLALSFTAYGDGTLPLPVVLDGVLDASATPEASTSAALKLNLTKENATPTTPNIPGFGNPCSGLFPSFKSLTGKLRIAAQDSTVLGKCIFPSSKPTSEVLPFAFVAYNATTVYYVNVKSALPASGTWTQLTADVSLVDMVTKETVATFTAVKLKASAN